jgi:cytochrome c
MQSAKTLNVTAALIIASSVSSVAQDAQKGAAVFNVCLACHAIGPGAQNKIGPELNGLDGRKAGTVPNFAYSDANKNSGIVWNEGTFEEYIKNPLVLRTINRSKTCGLTLVSSMLMAILKNNSTLPDL